MYIKSVYFVGSFPKESKAPKDNRPEFAFIGRSNVGKSSLINMLCNNANVAKVSGTPGKTRAINYFLINESWYLVDLPGYGYAKASKKDKAAWEKMIEDYLVLRSTLICAIVLIDSRHPLQNIDREFIDWLGQRHVPFVLVFTKIDKLKPVQQEENIQTIKNQLLEHWHSLPQTFTTSSKNKDGRDELLHFFQTTVEPILEDLNKPNGGA